MELDTSSLLASFQSAGGLLGEGSQQVLPSWEPCVLQYQPVRQHVLTATAGMTVNQLSLWEKIISDTVNLDKSP